MNTPALELAIQYVRQQVRRVWAEHGYRLPGVIELCRGAGVSTGTMQKALHALVREGALFTRRGGGIYIREDDSTPAEPAPARRPAESRPHAVRVRIERDVLSGQYRPGATLPSVKLLTERYGACYRTLSQALRDLESDGRIERYKRSYRVPSRRFGSFRPSLVLIARGNPNGSLMHLMPRTAEGLQYIERECWRSNVRVQTVSAFMDGAEHRFEHSLNALLQNRSSLDSVLGFLIWNAALDAFDLIGLLERLVATYKPVAMIDEFALTQRGDVLPRSRLLRFFTAVTSTKAGTQVGQFLLDLGHRRIAYISNYPTYPWALTRYQGLCHAYAKAGHGQGVRYLAPQTEPSGIAYDAQTNADILQAVVQTVRSRQRLAQPSGLSASQFSYSVAEWVHRLEMGSRIRPLMEQALADTGITAWVGADTETALTCADFLAEKGVGVPGAISVMGFDDNQEAFYRGLTSYNFNTAALMHAALSHVLNPDIPPSPPVLYRPVEVEGFLTVRATT